MKQEFRKIDGIDVDVRFHFISKGTPAGAFVRTNDGYLLKLSSKDNGSVYISMDEGKTWDRYSTMYTGPAPGKLTKDLETAIAIKTRSGVILWIYRDFETMNRLRWDSEKNDIDEEAGDPRLDVWCIRSLDDGRTWGDRQRIYKGYCGALINIIETKSGNVVVRSAYKSAKTCANDLCFIG